MISSLVLAVAACSWTDPGHARFTGTDAAVDDYKDIPAPVRAVLRERIRNHDYNDVADIRRNSVKGAADYDNLRDMHFGANGMCKTIKRPWKASHVERGLVYCEGEACIIVPTVCGNIARITRRKGNSPGFANALNNEALAAAASEADPVQTAEAAGGGGGGAGGGGGDALPSLDSLPPTGAGNSPSGSFASGSTGGSAGYPILGPGGGIGGGGGFLIPPVAVTPVTPVVPEPSTWALLVAGIAAIGFAAHRRGRG